MQWNKFTWRNFPIRTKVWVAVLVPMAALLLSCLLIAWIAYQDNEADEWVIGTLRVRLALTGLQRQFGMADSNLRTSLEFNKSDALTTGKKLITQAQEELAQIQDLTSDNPRQQQRISETSSLFDKFTKLFDAATSLQTLDAQRNEESALGPQIRDKINELDAEEARLLDTHTMRHGKLQSALWLVILFTILIGVVGTILGSTVLSSNVLRRINQMLESSLLIADGLPVKAADSSRDELGRLSVVLAQTSRVLSERTAEIGEANWKLESVLRAAASVCIVTGDMAGRISLFNTGATRLLGYSPLEAIGRDIDRILKEDPTAFPQANKSEKPSPPSRNAWRSGEMQDFETIFLRKDGMPLHVHVSIAPLREISGKIVGSLYVALDITPRKLLEAELRGKVEAMRQSANATLHTTDETNLPQWLRGDDSQDVVALSQNLNAINNWYEDNGEIVDPYQEQAPPSPRILIVDDFEPARFVLRVYLKDEGYELDFASTGKEALRQVADHAYQLILMDVEMPEMDGNETAAKIREWEISQGRPPVPIVALSAQPHPESLAGTVWTAYLQKPISKIQLLEEVKRNIKVAVAA